MESLKDKIYGKYGKSDYKLESDYRKRYDEDMSFRRIANGTKLKTTTLMKYTTKLEVSAREYDNCKNCKNIMECKNEVCGYVNYPDVNGDDLEFSYVPCRYKKELDERNKYLDNIYYFNIPKEIKKASMAEIDTGDKNRFEVIKWIKNYLTNVKKNISQKGLYLNGNFGCGKTYLLSAMLNELAKDGKRVVIVCYSELLRSLKESFYDNEEFKEKINMIKKADYLLLDDIGAESVTEWSRDEILGTILQYRMDEALPTFFTSNLTIKELEDHLAVTNREVDSVKARRIIERVKQLADSMTLISVNRRK